MARPRLLDLFCGAGGCSVGYARAGFDVVGVDLAPQPRYPYEFHQADALEYVRKHWRGFDAIHASPPCQAYSAMSNCRPGLAESYPELVGEVRGLLEETGRPYVIENVIGAGLAQAPDLMGRGGVLLCGRMFGLQLYRHRVFESSFPIATPPHPRHDVPASKAGHWKPGTIISVSGNCSPIAVARAAMGIDWMNRGELAEAIPPAYCEHIGEQLLAHLGVAA
jgi:DNA (cytosine-5)-methyltransferase 1